MQYYNTDSKKIYSDIEVLDIYKTVDLQQLKSHHVYLLVNGFMPNYDVYTQKLVQDSIEFSETECVCVIVYKIVDKTSDELSETFNTLKEKTKNAINKLVSTRIFSGFDIEMSTSETTKEILHFSYDQFDQGNFTDGLNASLIAEKYGDAVRDVMPTSVDWNAYRNYNVLSGGELIVLHLKPKEFIQLYLSAMTHKQKNMIFGQQLKNMLSTIKTIDELKNFISKYDIYIE